MSLALLFKTQKIALYSTTKTTPFLHGSCLFLRLISSNSSCAAEFSSLVGPSTDVSASAKRLEKSTLSRKELNRDYTVSYLVESCGLTPKDALSASEKIHFATPDRPNSVLDLLRNHGLSSTQITNAVRTYPKLLGLDAQKIILPKLEYFQSIGVSVVVLAQILSYNPVLLARSLKNQIKPVCNIIKSFLQSDKKLCRAIKGNSWLLSIDHDKHLVPNIGILQEIGVSNPNISTKWGWYEEDILSAFSKHPHCMVMSEKKLNLAMEFLVNTMGWPSKCIAQQPIVLLFSLEKSMIPRCSVIRVLWTKGLLSKDLRPRTILQPVEKVFLERYVTKYEEQVPQLLSIYKGKIDAFDL